MSFHRQQNLTKRALPALQNIANHLSTHGVFGLLVSFWGKGPNGWKRNSQRSSAEVMLSPGKDFYVYFTFKIDRMSRTYTNKPLLNFMFHKPKKEFQTYANFSLRVWSGFLLS